jgi:exosome complex RNA-binding protein Csl4
MLGVLRAKSAEGHTMTAVSFNTMQCPVTQAVEKRKVARPSSGGMHD